MSNSIRINGYERHTPEVGDAVLPDNWNKLGVWPRLEASDGCSDDLFPGCEFRLPSVNLEDVRYAVNVTVTGDVRSSTHGHIGWQSRCRIEFVGDGEPSSFYSGWIFFPDLPEPKL